mmetsp:Transcript_4277/g.4700  ORF Transcript_4277/g.4700 Transcript_4277/m.4700 type:complete len:167 (-) Transcript_4277:569-1069(-)
MNVGTVIGSIILSPQISFVFTNSESVEERSSNIEIEIAQRLIFSLALLLLLFVFGIGIVNLLFVEKYPLTIPQENNSIFSSASASASALKSTSNIRGSVESQSEVDTSAIESDEDITTNITSETGDLEDDSYDSEELDTLTFLDQHTFYNNLNNSSQYLRRDSFSQ